MLGRVFHHVSSDLKCSDKGSELNFFAGSAKKSLFEFGKLDQEVNPDLLWQLKTMDEQMDLRHDILKRDNGMSSKTIQAISMGFQIFHPNKYFCSL